MCGGIGVLDTASGSLKRAATISRLSIASAGSVATRDRDDTPNPATNHARASVGGVRREARLLRPAPCRLPPEHSRLLAHCPGEGPGLPVGLAHHQDPPAVPDRDQRSSMIW